MAGPLALEPSRCVFILVDVINAVAKGQGPPYTPRPERASVVRNSRRLIDHCRSVGTPLIFVTTHRRRDQRDAPRTIADVPGGSGDPMLAGTPATEVVDELRPREEDYILVKPRFSAFYGTDLDSILRTLGTETVLVGGISTQRSVEGTARDAKNRDLQCVVVSDCCTAGEQEVHEMTIKHVLPLLVRVRTTDEVIAALRP
jgi:nicotinamidase-related amidase